MSWKRWCAVVGCVGFLFFLLLFFNRSVSFQDLSQARTSVEDVGYVCTGDRADGKSVNGFMVSRQPIVWTEMNSMWKAGPMGDDWKGRVWITKSSTAFPLQTTPNDQAPRVWGNVLAFGDDTFLDEIESKLRHMQRFSWL